MGRGIAVVFAYAGHDVLLVDLKRRPEEDLARLRAEALGEVRAVLDTLVDIGLMASTAVGPILARVRFAGGEEAQAALAAADVIFEGVPETLPAKREALELVSRLARPDAVVASTTSTIMADELQAFVTPPGRFLNAHWLNPAYLVPLVEVSPGKATAAETTERLVALLEGIGKVPVVCKASPGFIVPRLQALVMNEAARLVEEGVARTEDIDKATRLGFGFRFAVLGVLEFIDWGGGDILHHASRYLRDATGSDRFAAPRIVEDNMQAGRTGLTARAGFLDYSTIDIETYRRQRLAAFVSLLKHMGVARPPVV
jgi:3-hydroxybutyryl-CoA dehydrogenase